MDDAFESFKELIETGLKNGMPQEAKLIILGQILSAVTYDKLTENQGWELEKMMGGRQQWDPSPMRSMVT